MLTKLDSSVANDDEDYRIPVRQKNLQFNGDPNATADSMTREASDTKPCSTSCSQAQCKICAAPGQGQSKDAADTRTKEEQHMPANSSKGQQELKDDSNRYDSSSGEQTESEEMQYRGPNIILNAVAAMLRLSLDVREYQRWVSFVDSCSHDEGEVYPWS